METNQVSEERPRPARRVIFRFKTLNVAELDQSDCEVLAEIRILLQENPIIKLHPNVRFVCQGVALNDSQSLDKQIDLSGQDLPLIVELKQEAFTPRSAEKHIYNCAEFFLAPLRFLGDGFIDFNILVGRQDFVQSMVDAQKPEFRDLEREDPAGGDLRLLESFSFLPQAFPGDHFFRSLRLSRHGPPSHCARVQQDFFYFDLVTKEDQYFCITVRRQGIFVNESTEKVFSEKPRSTTFLSLLELLSSLSPAFDHDLREVLDLSDQEAYNALCSQPVVASLGLGERESTFGPISSPSVWESGLRGISASLSDSRFGHNLRVYRDWNEEFQNLRSLPTSEPMQHLQRTKLLRKVCEEFAKAAKEVGRGVIEGQFLPLNPIDNKLEECYVFNNLFVTFAQDRLDWEIPRAETSPTTYSSVNMDIVNLQSIYQSELNEVNAINTVAVDYLGCRVVVQAIISGILHFDQKTWNCYGSIDDGKTINAETEFEPLFAALGQHFNLTLNNCFKDAQGQEFRLHGSPEVKGIKAGDGRKYVMDLLRLSPRDLNFPDKTAHETCVLRPELIKNFSLIHAYTEAAKRSQNGTDQAPAPNSSEPVVAEQKDQEKADGEVSKEAVKEPERPLPALNPSLATALESVEESPEARAAELTNLKAVSDFLNDAALSHFVRESSSSTAVIPVDMEMLVDSLHKTGINIRYLGRILELLDSKVHAHTARLIERAIIVRSLRKYLRELAPNCSQGQFLQAVVLALNIFLGDKELRDFVDQKARSAATRVGMKEESKPSQPVMNGEVEHVEKSKKKSGKRKKPTIKVSGPPEEQCELFTVSSAELLARVIDIAAKRYQFKKERVADFGDFVSLQNHKDKLTFLREVGRSLGLVFLARPYSFSTSKPNLEYPVKLRDIIQIKPLLKGPTFSLDGLRYTIKGAENEMLEGNFDNALAVFRGCQNLIVNTYGLFNIDFINVTSKISLVEMRRGNAKEAVKNQLLVVKIAERVFGLDHPSTVFAIAELANYLYEANKRSEESVLLYSLALSLSDLIGGFVNPASLVFLNELHLLTSGSKDLSFTSQVLQEHLRRSEILFGESDERLSPILNSLASAKAGLGKFKDASLLQARYSFLLKRALKSPQIESKPHFKQIIEAKIAESEQAKNVYVQRGREAESKALNEGTTQKTKNKLN